VRDTLRGTIIVIFAGEGRAEAPGRFVNSYDRLHAAKASLASEQLRDYLGRQVARAIYEDGCAGTLELFAAAITPKHSDRGHLVA
jgi:hypothetical protein